MRTLISLACATWLVALCPAWASGHSPDHIYTLSSRGWQRNNVPSWQGFHSEVFTCSVCEEQVQVQIDVGAQLSPGAPFTTDEQFLASVKTPAQQKQFADGLLRSKIPFQSGFSIRIANTGLTKVGGKAALQFTAIIEAPQMPAARETRILLIYKGRLVSISLNYIDGSFSPKARKAVDGLLSSLKFL